ncbi:MAG: hypothetical protein LAO24_20550 [Acidobacteriia bacterium]|nr:hypothetical protein [Terriglobia bacterium]
MSRPTESQRFLLKESGGGFELVPQTPIPHWFLSTGGFDGDHRALVRWAGASGLALQIIDVVKLA